MSCSGPRRMDAPDEWFGSAGLPPARLAGNADYFHDRARRSVSAPDRARRGSFRLSHKTFRRRGPGEGRSRGSRRLGSTAQPPEQRTEPVRFPASGSFPCVKRRASAFLTKPFDDEELLTAVRLALAPAT